MQLIFTGLACSNRCLFCSQQGRADDAERNDIIKRAAEAARKDREIAFVGGEPTLSENLLEAVSSAKKAGAGWILIQTNARKLAYPGYAKSLAGANVDALDVSLQGSTPLMHDYHTQAPGSWAQTVLGLRRAKEAGLLFGISTVITRSNFRHLEDLVRLAHHLGALAVHLDPAKPYGSAALLKDRIVCAPELAVEFIAASGRLALQLGLGLHMSGHFAGNPAARRLFAGIGDHNNTQEPSSKKVEADSHPIRPRPGLKERRAAEKISGTALQTIFPELFSAQTHG